MLNALTVANSILYMGFTDNIPITPMKLQKLTYFMYKQYLKNTGKKLFQEDFLKWMYGPVVESIYYQFKGFGAKPITRFSYDAKGNAEMINLKINSPAKDALEYIWNKYKYYSASQLSNMTHSAGSAWDKADTVLEQEDIRNEPEYG